MIGQLSRYGAMGLIVYAVDFLTFWLIHAIAPSLYLIANVAGKAAGAATGFVLHKTVTFAGEQQHATGRQALLYALVLGINMAGSSALLWLAVGLGAPTTPARIAIDGIVIATSFLASRFLIFRPA
ncbi:MAG: GtrA family protein [Sphingomonadaceae bacterium]